MSPPDYLIPGALCALIAALLGGARWIGWYVLVWKITTNHPKRALKIIAAAHPGRRRTERAAEE